jgi:hypothetical protein
MAAIDTYIEAGERKVFAGALAWPGWCRSAPDEGSALQALVDYGNRYRLAIGSTARSFRPPGDPSGLRVVERTEGNSSTDFGVPAIPPAWDSQPLDEEELAELTDLLDECWAAFDASARAARGKELQKGPRGGGRDVEKIRAHVLDGETSYLTQLGGRYRSKGKIDTELKRVRREFLDALVARVRGDLPDAGPRGGKRWSARYAIRRSAWHSLDHAWEIEDRLIDEAS